MSTQKDTKTDPAASSAVETIVMLLYLTARELWGESLHAGNASKKDSRYNQMKNVSKGDLVFEISSFKQRVTKENVMDYVGYLEEVDEKNWRYAIRRFDGKIVKWENCEFLKIPVEA